MNQDGIVIASDPLSDMNRYSDVIDAQSIIEECSDEGSIRDCI